MRHAEHVMGTVVSIDLADDLPEPTLRTLIADTCAWLHEVDARFSTYRDDSEVNRFHRGELALSDCSPDLRHVLDACAGLWRTTDGYFDAYAGGPLDPSGYVKGWSVEVASARLAAAGSTNHCVNAGGDIRARGRTAAGAPWRVGIRHPWQQDKLSWVLAITDGAVATSGTYERGDHVRNPRTGAPARGLRSVTVTGPDLALADSYATAALAMGEPGIAWLAKLVADGYESAVVTEDTRAFTTAGLPVAV
ncbi:FAD:protein FMN transferase [Actinoplanes sp. RD1]|uniref:FAD:protein FMN transferase n=1 Tax=Actinoplanes sp. RD1 TaxID=3064538 RepID=UPI00274122DB|nr:FAD:protein FMN transferase [Actinoplanes sp. RD1]